MLRLQTSVNKLKFLNHQASFPMYKEENEQNHKNTEVKQHATIHPMSQ